MTVERVEARRGERGEQRLPYGGWKGSGVGHEESIEELFSYSQVKSVSVML